MLSHVEIKNFQSHKHSRLEFHPGLNGIVGNSDSGKSAILRAIHWNRENRPTGEGHISKWEKDSKGKLLGECSVTVGTNGGDVTRTRSAEFNGYRIGDQTFEAISTTVPDAVRDAWNFTEVNVQKQLDPPFLLSKSGPEVSRFFNQILNLDDMDKLISAAASEFEKTSGEHKRIVGVKGKTAKQNRPGELDELDSKIAKLEWIDRAKELVAIAQKQESEISRISSEIGKINQLIWNIGLASQTIEKHGKVLAAIPMFEQAESSLAKSKANELERETLGRLLNSIAAANILKDRAGSVLSAEPFLIRAEAINAEMRPTHDQFVKLHLLIMDCERTQETVQEAGKILLAEPFLAQAEKSIRAMSETERKLSNLLVCVNGISSAMALKNRAGKILLAEPFMSDLEKKIQAVSEHTQKLSRLSCLLTDIRMITATIERSRNDLAQAEKDMPEQCPTCGGLIPHNH